MVMRDFTRRSWKKLFYLIAVFVVILTFAEANAKMKERNLELPQTVGIYTRSVLPQMVDAANIFDYMDGAGELYLAYRFQKLAVYKYEAGSQAEFGGHNTDMVVNCQAVKVFPVHLFSCGYAVPYIPGHIPDQNLG